MSVDYDEATDSLYVYLRTGIKRAYGEPLDDLRYVDFGADGKPIGVEFLSASKGVKLDGIPQADAIAELLHHRHMAFA